MFVKSAEAGSDFSMDYLGDCYYYGRGVEKNYSTAITWYTKASEKGNKYAKYMLGWCYEKGEGVTADIETAKKYYTEASELGHNSSKERLENIIKTEENEKKRNELYSEALNYRNSKYYYAAFPKMLEAAELGHVDAMNWVGVFYQNGQGTETNLVEAEKWYKKGVNKGDIYYAGTNLGILYYNQQKYSEALEWYNKGAAEGNHYAFTGLGDCYYYGCGVEKDYSKAMVYYLAASGGNHSGANYMVGWCYEHGQGTDKDMENAKYYYGIAAKLGHSGAQQRLDELGWS